MVMVMVMMLSTINLLLSILLKEAFKTLTFANYYYVYYRDYNLVNDPSSLPPPLPLTFSIDLR